MRKTLGASYVGLAGAVVCVALVASPASSQGQQAHVVKASADTYTSAASSRKSFGRRDALVIDARPKKVAYLRFKIRPRSGERITRATLRVYARGSGAIRARVTDPNWSERRVTYRTAPDSANPILSRARVRRSGWVSIDVTPTARDGVVSIALATSSRRQIRISSRESGKRRAPRLLVTTGDGSGQPPGTQPTPAPGPEHPAQPPASGRYCAEGPIGPGAQCIWYTREGPWNKPIEAGAYARSALPTQTPTGPITSDPGQYAYPIYYVDGSTPKVDVRIGGVFGVAGDNDTTINYMPRTTVQVPLKPEFVASAGSDGSLIVIDTDTGAEYGFWKLSNSGGWSATNGSSYNIKWDGSPGDGNDRAFTSRGAGLPYGAGIVKAWEVKQGRIDHALAMALGGAVKAGTTHVFPATKSDGTGGAGGVPEGTRYQLDPSLDVDKVCASSPVGAMMARAMQRFGVYVVDNSGRTKLFVEGEDSAKWGEMLKAETASCIPVGMLRRVS